MPKTVDYRRTLRHKLGIQAGQARRVWLPTGLAMTVAAAMLWSLCWRNPKVSFLPPDPPAEWILFPTVSEMVVHRDGPRRTVFRRRFTIAHRVEEARLSVRALTQFAVAVNSVEVAGSDPSGSWKAPSIRRLKGDLFTVGENELVATVTCERGPPALWLALEVGHEAVVSNADWQASLMGANPQPARLADVSLDGDAAARGAERPPVALGKVWPACLVFAGLSGAIVAVTHLCLRRASPAGASGRVLMAVLFGGLAVAWCGLSISNAKSLRCPMGYDSPLHMEYIDYVAQNHSLPLGNEGMEMGQAPLYYLLASMLSPLPATPTDRESRVFILRGLSVVVSIAQLALLAGCLRQVYRGRFSPQMAGLFVAGCLPAQLYLMHNTSNDLLAATLSTAGLYLAMKVMGNRETQLGETILLGICLGAAILAKLTALPVVLATLLVLGWQLLARRHRIGQSFRRLIVPGLVCSLVCGWFFARNYSNFGHLLPPDQAGFSYWQDPGYATVGQFLRFGRSLSEPFLASFAGVPDGFYSTLWGDGGWGGVTSRAGRPPWNYELMAAGYLLALVPTALILTGGLALVRQAACRWLPQKLLLLAALAASFGGMLLFYLQHPMHGTIKAFYGLPSVAAICIFAAEGYRVLSRDIFWRQLVLASSLGAWGLTALASFVVDHSSPETQAWIARQQAVDGNVDAALALIASLTRENPADADLHLTAGQLLQFAKRPQEAQQEVAAAVRLDPNNADAQLLLAQTLGSLHKQDDELPLLQNVLRLAPDSRLAYKELALLHLARGDDVAAAETARAGLRVSPDEMRLHLVIAQASARLGRTDEAIEHYKTVLEWEPNQATALAGLASLEPSQSDQDLRDPALAGARRPAETEQAPAAREKRE